ncbi:MAG: EboA domain-containing protein [Granulosicoccus sp.]
MPIHAAVENTNPETKAITRKWLLERVNSCLDDTNARWFASQLEALSDHSVPIPARSLDLAFGLVPRRLGKKWFLNTTSDRDTANRYLPGWHPEHWQIDEAARILLMSTLGDENFAEHFPRMLRHADLGEQLALYKGIALYPQSEQMTSQVAAGLRTDIKGVFEAIAHCNPWPAMMLDEAHWNQMVLKALFINSGLYFMVDLDRRSNASLANTLIDYAHERRAAGRTISSELWRCAVPFTDLTTLTPLLPVTDMNNQWPASHEVAGLTIALQLSNDPELQQLAQQHAPGFDGISNGDLNWHTLHAQEYSNP